MVGFNGGTTTTATARHFMARPDVASGSTREPTTVVTNALNIATELVLRPAIRCVTLGGVARAESYEQTGSLAIQVMEQLWLDLLILGVGGIDRSAGATCRHEDEAGISAAMAAHADRGGGSAARGRGRDRHRRRPRGRVYRRSPVTTGHRPRGWR